MPTESLALSGVEWVETSITIFEGDHKPKPNQREISPLRSK